MVIATILVDNREQKPYEFEGYPVDTESVTLRTADYTLARFCDYDESYDTYTPRLGVERKSGPDLLQSITHSRKRFKKEIKRAADWPEELKIVIETSRETIENDDDFMQYRDVHPNQVLGTIDAWDTHYNADFSFEGSRHQAEQCTFDTLMTWLRTYRSDEGGVTAD